ncbi:hypothetical protein [uncultured Bacteroides sp.]|uniref:hypothetical protein n=1 Tax=uncultured Bacteroides sp. TaxID=162156 RepID=UPI0025F49FF5|nr:hypothetical protein [uncultured Bacteroides sp.]
MIDFLTIILLVFGVLQIILFFKMWGMTNDVNKITKKLQCEKDKTWNVRRALLYGDQELAKKELMDCIISDFEKFGDGGYGFNCVEDIISKYEPAFKQLEIEIPENLKAIKSYADIKNIIKIGN